MANNLETFSVEFKRDCLAFLLKDELAAKAVGLDLPADFFEYDTNYNIIFLAFREFLEKYSGRPSRHEMVDIIKEACDEAKLDAAETTSVLDSLTRLWKWNKYNAKYVKDKLYDAVTCHAMFQVGKQMPAFIDDGDYDGFLQAMAKARSVGTESPPLTEYWRDTDDRIERVRKASVRRISTGMVHLDSQMKGGLPRGAIAMLMGASGFGKSALLGQLALRASLKGYTVAYLTLEISADMFMLRCDANNLEVSLDDVDRMPAKKIRKHASKFWDSLPQVPGVMYVQYFPTKSIGVHQIESYVQRLRDEEGVTLDLLVVDYFDLLKMAGNYDKKYEALEENVEMLRGLAGQYNMAIWTASQTNRGGLEKETVDMEDIAAGYGKVFPLDLLVTISQTKAERKQNVMRLHTAKSRVGEQGGIIWVEPTWKHMKFVDLTEEEAKDRGLFKKTTSTPASDKPLVPFGPQA